MVDMRIWRYGVHQELCAAFECSRGRRGGGSGGSGDSGGWGGGYESIVQTDCIYEFIGITLALTLSFRAILLL